MIACAHTNRKKYGHDRRGHQRYRCLDCGATWTVIPSRPIGDLRIDQTKAVKVLQMLLEGVSIRSTVRLTGVSKNAILRLLELVGHRSQYYWTVAMRGLPASNVQADETWGFVFCKEKTAVRKHLGPECGDAYTFLAIERDTKLVLAYHVGRRDPQDTAWFSEKLRRATSGRFQLTTDGFKPYCTAIPEAFSGQIDFAQLVKIYGKQPAGRQENKTDTRYSPGEITGIKKHAMWGNPDMGQVSTSFVERKNLSIRMGVRRMTRLTNAFSKKWENHEYHLALWFLYYNFCRRHQTLSKRQGKPTTPAMAAGLADHVWGLEELLGRLAAEG